MKYKGTLFMQLHEAIRDDYHGDENALERKLMLIAICKDKFGELATMRAIETAEKNLRK